MDINVFIVDTYFIGLIKMKKKMRWELNVHLNEVNHQSQETLSTKKNPKKSDGSPTHRVSRLASQSR